MTSQEVAAALGVTRSAVLNWARAGRLGTKEGRDYRFTPEEVMRFQRPKGGRPKKDKEKQP